MIHTVHCQTQYTVRHIAHTVPHQTYSILPDTLYTQNIVRLTIHTVHCQTQYKQYTVRHIVQTVYCQSVHHQTHNILSDAQRTARQNICDRPVSSCTMVHPLTAHCETQHTVTHSPLSDKQSTVRHTVHCHTVHCQTHSILSDTQYTVRHTVHCQTHSTLSDTQHILARSHIAEIIRLHPLSCCQ